jgi:hypothetical protein
VCCVMRNRIAVPGFPWKGWCSRVVGLVLAVQACSDTRMSALMVALGQYH